MKKRLLFSLLALLLCLCLTLTALAAGGDTLISLSYLEDIFAPQLMDDVRALASSRSAPEAGDSLGGCVKASVSAGGAIELTTGETAMLISGGAYITVSSGSLVNATAGWESSGGSLRLYNRYIVCESSAASISVTQDSVFFLSPGADITSGNVKSSPFTDVPIDSWYYNDVVSAAERGLINGMTASTYVPSGTLTTAQCIKLAACMHQLWHSGNVTLANSSSGPWYGTYVDYALENGIISAGMQDYDAVIDRLEFVKIFYRALPGSCFEEINTVSDGAIPDMPESDDGAYEVYVFYRAGILTGYDDGSFDPAGSISRAEVAAIMNRMFDPEARRMFTLK